MLTLEQLQPNISVLESTQSGVTHPDTVGHAGGAVVVMTAQGGGLTEAQSVGVATAVSVSQPRQQPPGL